MTDSEDPIDPLQRVYRPVEKRNLDGTSVLSTSDHTKYRRGLDGVIRRVVPKEHGKTARKRRAQARQGRP